MHPAKVIAIGLLALPIVEISAFVVVASLVGFFAAFLLLILVSCAGILVLRHFGGGVTSLRTAAGRSRIAAASLDGSGAAAGVGGILLIIPGFATGLLGALMVFPLSRRWLVTLCRRLLSADRRPVDPEILDLSPDEWRALPNPKLPPDRPRSKA
jgi:UPF0716 protein FxsA